jgi:hypothetical protein
MSRALTDVGMITSQTPGWQAEVDAFIQSAGEHAVVVSDLCRLLFPATERYLGSNTTYPSNWLPIWRKNRQVANRDVLAIYLSKQLPPGTVPAATVDMAVLTMARKELFQAMVDNLSADDLDDFLTRLAGYADDITPAAVLPGCTVLLGLYPRLRSQSKGFLDVGPEIAVDRVVLQLLRQVDDEAERTRIVEELCTGGLTPGSGLLYPRVVGRIRTRAAHPRRRVQSGSSGRFARAPSRQYGAGGGRAGTAVALATGLAEDPATAGTSITSRRRRRRRAVGFTSAQVRPGGRERGERTEQALRWQPLNRVAMTRRSQPWWIGWRCPRGRPAPYVVAHLWASAGRLPELSADDGPGDKAGHQPSKRSSVRSAADGPPFLSALSPPMR